MRKTLLRIIGLVLCLIVIVVSFIAIAINWTFTSVVMEQHSQRTAQELQYFNKNVSFMHQTAREYAYALIDTPSLEPLYQEENMESTRGYSMMIDLAKAISSNMFLDSVTLYSGPTGNCFSTCTSLASEDPFLRSSIANYKDIEMLRPTFRALPLDIYYKKETVFTYFYYQTDSSDALSKAVSVNMDAGWICKQLGRLKTEGANTYIMDIKSGYALDSSGSIREMGENDRKVAEKIMSNGQAEGSFTEDFGSKRLYQYLWNKELNWAIVIDSPDILYHDSLALVTQIMIPIIAYGLLIALAVSILVSLRIYRPIFNIYRRVAGKTKPSRLKLVDDLAMISDTIQLSQKQQEEYLRYKNSTGTILFDSYIRALLRGDLHNKNSLHELNIAELDMLQQPTALILFRIDRFDRLGELDFDLKTGCHYVMAMVAEKTFGEHAKVIYLKQGQFVLLSFGEEDNPDSLNQKVSLLQGEVRRTTKMTISAFIGGIAVGDEDLTAAYQVSLALMKYSVIFQREALLDSSFFSGCFGKQESNKNIEKHLYDKLLAGKLQEAESLFEQFLAQAFNGDIDGFMLSVTRFFLELEKKVDTINQNRVEKRLRGPKELYVRIVSFESLDDILDFYHEFAEEAKTRQAASEDRHDALPEAVRQYLGVHYREEISQKGVAAVFKVSVGYLGMIFKENYGCSIMDYVNNLRMEKSLFMLEQTELSILEIMRQVGFNSESSFYRIFKAKYGVTPKAYQLNHVISPK